MHRVKTGGVRHACEALLPQRCQPKAERARDTNEYRPLNGTEEGIDAGETDDRTNDEGTDAGDERKKEGQQEVDRLSRWKAVEQRDDSVIDELHNNYGTEKTHLLRHFILKTIVLPRQARDKHR
eukprot:COSAG06_NODE_186_length_20792_cov_1041.487443_29_plen_124_part_00